MKKFLSIILVGLMVVTMLPMAVLPASAVTEAAEVTDNAFITYSSGVTQYVKHNNYLYKVAYTNLKIESVDIDISSYEDLRIYGTTNRYCALLLAYQGSNAKSSNLPTSPGKSVSFYTADTYASNEKKPVVTVTCMAVSEPVWSWNDVSSATAVFTSTDGGATMTVDAAIEISEKTAENCLETDTTAYTATATANGKEYTNVKTIYGEQGSHNIEYIKSGDYMIGSCTNGCGMNCTHNWTDKNDYLCDNCGFECHHESYTDGFCTVCGFECAHENFTNDKCDVCGEEGIVVTITMTDSYSDGWRGNGIVVKQLVDGAYTEVATATFEDGASETFTAFLRQDGIYAFSWVYGEHPEDCGFTLTVDGETVYECADVGTLADSEIFYIICKHTSYTDGKCDVCDYECPHENQTGSVCEICGEHICSYDNGFCTECDAYQPATLVTNENYESFYLKADYVGYYAISNAGQLFWYANYINTVDRTANAVLTADIDLENRPWTPIGSTGENSNNFRGIFDGQNYTIKGLYVEGGRAGLGFFGEVRTGTVKNFTIYGEVVVNTEVDYVGGVIGSICGVNGENDLERNGAIIQNIRSFVNLTAKAHGVGKIGGFVGYANHQSLIENCSWYGTFDAGIYRVDNGAGGFIGRIQENSSEVTIRNCGAYGTIKTNYAGDYNDTATIYMGGFLSFSNTNAQTVLENCLFAGRFKRGENLTDQAFLGAFGTLRSVKAIKNCYYLGDDGLEAVHSDSLLKPGSDNVEITKVTGEELKFDMVAAMLGEYWEQGVHYPTLKDHGSHWGSETYSYTDNGDGTHDMVCTGCGYVEVYNEAHSGGTATCTEQAKCEHCGASYGEFDWTNHEGEYVTVWYNDYQHVSEYECCHIGFSVVYEDHKYENYTVITPADCVNNAWETGTCICGDTHTREIAGSATDHNWSNKDGICANGCGETCPHDSYTDGVCDKCGYECAHTWDEDGYCRKCKTFCKHENNVNGVCTVCDCVLTFSVITGDTVSYYDSFDDALENAEEGSTVKLMKGLNQIASYEINKSITFDLNGNSWDTGSSDYIDVYTFVTFTDSVGTGSLNLSLNLYAPCLFNSGTYKGIGIMFETEDTLGDYLAECHGFFDHYTGEFKDVSDEKYVMGAKVDIYHKLGAQTCKGYQCEVCGEYFGEADPDAHDWSNKDGICAICAYECPHEWGEGVLTRPTFESEGYYTYTCTLCGHSYTEPAKEADTTALNDASMKVTEYIDNDTLTQEARDGIYKSYRDILKNNGNLFDEFGFVRGDLVEEDQPAINAVTAELEKIVADAEEKIASGEYVKAEYTEIDEVIKAIDEALENATISDEIANELSDIKSQLEALKENENTSMADAAELLERVKAVAETMADCANGIHSFTKYEETEAPMCGVEGKEISYCDHGCGATDEREIPALTHEPLEAVKENEVAPKCGVAGSYDLVVYCDLCGDELDRDTVTVDALTHKDEDGDYLCDHGCGHEFEKPADPDLPEEPEDPEDPSDKCDHLCHRTGFMGFIWKIINFFFKLFNIQQYCDCGKLHY